MKIKELIDNNTFSFNVHFRIYQYIPGRKSSEEGVSILKYDSYFEEGQTEYRLFEHDISAINQSANGTVEIEYL